MTFFPQTSWWVCAFNHCSRSPLVCFVYTSPKYFLYYWFKTHTQYRPRKWDTVYPTFSVHICFNLCSLYFKICYLLDYNMTISNIYLTTTWQSLMCWVLLTSSSPSISPSSSSSSKSSKSSSPPVPIPPSSSISEACINRSNKNYNILHRTLNK